MTKTLLEQAEEARSEGNRARFLELTKQAEKEQYDALQKRHAAEVEKIKKEFPIGEIVPVINNRVTDIKDGCGTQRGWIEIYFGDKRFKPQELRKRIRERKEAQRVTAKYSALKFSDRAKKGVCIGQYNEALDDLKTSMTLERIYGLQEAEEEMTFNDSGAYKYAYDEAIGEGYTDEEAEEKGQATADEERDEEYRKYKGRFVSCLEYVLQYADLLLEEDKKQNWYLRPATSWEHSAAKMAEVISGHGMFEFKSALELKEGLPAKTYAEAVIVHLHWLKHGPEIYGNRSYQSKMDY